MSVRNAESAEGAVAVPSGNGACMRCKSTARRHGSHGGTARTVAGLLAESVYLHPCHEFTLTVPFDGIQGGGWRNNRASWGAIPR